TADATDDHVLYDERRDGDAVAGQAIRDGNVPELIAGFGVERDEVSVHRADENAIAKNGNAAIDISATGIDGRGKSAAITPEDATGASIERDDIARRLRDVHDAIGYERRRFDDQGGGHLVYPLEPES